MDPNALAFPKYASVILDLALDKSLDYGIPTELLPKVQCGSRVEVPVRGKMYQGYVVGLKETPEFTAVKPLSRVLSEDVLITEELFKLALWMAKYYCTPLRQVLKTIVPAPLRSNMRAKEQLFVMRAKTREQLQEHCIKIRNSSSKQADVLDVMLTVKSGILLSELLERTQGSRSPVDTLVKQGFLALDIIRVDRSPLVDAHYLPTKPKVLNPEQAAAFEKITKSLEESQFETHLLHGVTGSGKTEIYLQAIEKALQMGKGSIVLVPEIALTAQTIERFHSRFDTNIAILHSRLSAGERFDEWNRIRRSEARIVIGARSAIFSPVPHLGLIIVDEEQENAYKQNEEMPCYHARDVAVMRAKMEKATVVLGSATPSLESYHNAQTGKYKLSTLQVRADAANMPKVTIVDMAQEYAKAQGFTSFSELLLDGIKKRIEKGEQTILFLNRRGYHTSLVCQQCREALKCRDCDSALTFHKGENTLACHLCDFTLSPPPSCCPKCRSPSTMKFRGVGTEQVEKALHAVLPEVRTLRVDGDTTRHKGSHQKLLRAFATGKADVLIGTQMIAKGLHFPSVTLVGVLNSDSSLNIPDFRASETVFQLLTQVSGRAGRGAIAGEVIVQTIMPGNRTIQLASRHDFESFYAEEIVIRQAFCYPPSMQMAKLLFSGADQAQVLAVAEKYFQSMRRKLPQPFAVTPVVPAGHFKIKNRYRYQFLMRGPSIGPINQALGATQQEIAHSRAVSLRIDINPTSTFF